MGGVVVKEMGMGVANKQTGKQWRVWQAGWGGCGLLYARRQLRCSVAAGSCLTMAEFWLAWKVTTRRASMAIGSPVRGLRPGRGDLAQVGSCQNLIFTSSPWASSCTMRSKSINQFFGFALVEADVVKQMLGELRFGKRWRFRVSVKFPCRCLCVLFACIGASCSMYCVGVLAAQTRSQVAA